MADREVKVTVDIAQTGGLSGALFAGIQPTQGPTLTGPGAAFSSLATPAGPKLSGPAAAGTLAGVQPKSTAFDLFATRVLFRLQQIAENTGASGPGASLVPKDDRPGATTKGKAFGSSFEQSFTNIRNIASSMTALAGSSAPLTVSTLTGSVQLLAGEITGLMIPAFNQTSLAIQGAADRFHDLDEKARGAVSRLGAVSGPILGGAVAIGTLGAVIRPVVGMVASMASAGPIGWAALAAAGTVPALASTDHGRDALGKLAEALSPLADAFSEVIEKLAPTIDVLADAIISLTPVIGSLASQIAFSANLAPSLNNIWDFLSGNVPTLHPGANSQQHLIGSSIMGNAQSFGSGADMYHTILSEALGQDEMKIRLMNKMIENQERQIADRNRINTGGRAPGMPASEHEPYRQGFLNYLISGPEY